MNNIWEIKKSKGEDCYATVSYKGTEVLTILWLGESDDELVCLAKHQMRGND